MPSKAGNRRRRIAIRLAIVIPLLVALGVGAWYGVNLLVARQLRLIDLVDIGDLDGVLYVCRWDPSQTDKVSEVQELGEKVSGVYPIRSVPRLNKMEVSPLHLATRKRHVVIARELLSRGANPAGFAWWFSENDDVVSFARGVDGMEAASGHDGWMESTLGAAVSTGDEKLVVEMLERGAPVGSEWSGTVSPLYRAIGLDRADLVELLLRAGATECYYQSEDELRTISSDYTMLDIAIITKKPKATAAMRRLGIPSGDDRTLLHYAALENRTDVAKVLIDGACVVDQKDWMGRTPLAWALIRGNSVVVEALLESGADLTKAQGKNPRNISSLHYAVEEGYAGVVELLIKHGVDVNKLDELGNSPMRLAIDAGEAEIVGLLAAAGAKPVEKTESISAGKSRLCTYRLEEFWSNTKEFRVGDRLDPLKLGREHGIWLPDQDRGSKGFWAIDRPQKGRQDFEKILLVFRAPRKYLDRLKTFEQNCHGDILDLPPLSGNLLHLAVYYDEPDVIRTLVESGEDVNAKDILGCTPLDWARTRRLRAMLHGYGAKKGGAIQ